MTKFDQFESIFRSALKDTFKYEQLSFRSVLVVTDMKEKDASAYAETLKKYLSVLGPDVRWTLFHNKANFTPVELLDAVAEEKPDLICTYRNLNSQAWQLPYSLGEHLDVLTQKSETPVLVLPHPDAKSTAQGLKGTTNVMAMTDHLSDNPRLINVAVALTEPGGSVFLSHIEDQGTFLRYMNAISKIPGIDTEMAEKEIRNRLLKDASDFIDSCAQALKEKNLPIKVKTVVGFGNRLSEYKKYIDRESLDLLVMNAKDNDQLAMHGLVYPLAIELRDIPLLLL